MEKTYNPELIEQKYRELWEKGDLFSSSANSSSRDAFSIVLPPPNVTGSLHMGHAFQHTIMDVYTRYNRSKGNQTLWQPGTDHAGIATQMVVERQLSMQNISRHDLGREKFTEKVWDWKSQSGGTITSQMRRLGASVDWDRERFTMDESLSQAVRKVFVELYNEGLIYRGKRLVNWDPVLLTAVSDLEVISKEENGYLWYIKYQVADSDEVLVVATTRPETMLGDSAVAVHPDDERYQHLVGQSINLPLSNRKIPIIADDYVDMEFGTGCVKITPAHDFNDYEIGQRHSLEIINVLTHDAKINSNAPSDYQDLDRFEARKRIVADLEKQNLIEKIDPHTLMVPRGDRTNSIIEPYMTDQWFVKVKPLAEPAIEAVKNGSIRFVPENWEKTYFNWMENIEDWCISRQIWWGHRIPAWYDKEGKYYVADSLEEAQIQAGSDVELTQDDDVLDTLKPSPTENSKGKDSSIPKESQDPSPTKKAPKADTNQLNIKSQEEWEDIIKTFDFNGAAKMLVKNTVFKSLENQTLVLTLSSDFLNLLTPKTEDSIRNGLHKEYPAVDLIFEPGETNGHSLSQKESDEREQKRKETESQFLSDDGLKELQEVFNSKVDLKSIKSIKESDNV